MCRPLIWGAARREASQQGVEGNVTRNGKEEVAVTGNKKGKMDNEKDGKPTGQGHRESRPNQIASGDQRYRR